MQAGVDNNVIPTEATLKLKLHFSTPAVRERMVESIETMSANIARSYGVSEEMLPAILHKGYAPAVVNSPDLIARMRDVLAGADFVSDVIKDLRIPGSDDAFALIEDIDGVEGAYLGIGTAAPEVFAKAREAGHEFPFFVHEPNYVVDLEGITFGAKVAALLALDVLHR
jgi:hippurate hydrolase